MKNKLRVRDMSAVISILGVGLLSVSVALASGTPLNSQCCAEVNCQDNTSECTPPDPEDPSPPPCWYCYSSNQEKIAICIGVDAEISCPTSGLKPCGTKMTGGRCTTYGVCADAVANGNCLLAGCDDPDDNCI